MVKTLKPAMNKMMSAWLNVRKRKEASLTQSDDEEEMQNYQSGGTGTTSESESEATMAAKRPRFRDFKRAARNLQNLDEAGQDVVNSDTKFKSDEKANLG